MKQETEKKAKKTTAPTREEINQEDEARAWEATEDYSDDWSGFWEYEASRGW